MSIRLNMRPAPGSMLRQARGFARDNGIQGLALAIVGTICLLIVAATTAFIIGAQIAEIVSTL